MCLFVLTAVLAKLVFHGVQFFFKPQNLVCFRHSHVKQFLDVSRRQPRFLVGGEAVLQHTDPLLFRVFLLVI